MKNVNLAPPSSESEKAVRGNKPFILISLVVLMFLCFVYFLRITPFGKRWVSPYEDMIVTSISSFIGGRTKPDQKEKIAFNNQASGKEESVDRQTISQKATKKKEKPSGKKDAPDAKVEKKVDATQLTVEPVQKTPEKSVQKKTTSVGIKEEQVPDKRKTAKVASVKIPPPSISKKGTKTPIEIAGGHYYIQICSCVLKNNAEQAFRRLDYLGFSPLLKETVGRTKMHNIYMDHLQQAEATRLLDQLKDQGFDPVFLSGSEGKYRLRVASCLYEESAQKIVKELTRLGYRVNILKETTSTKMYSVLLGQYRTKDEAENTRLELKSNGFQSPILKRMPQT